MNRASSVLLSLSSSALLLVSCANVGGLWQPVDSRTGVETSGDDQSSPPRDDTSSETSGETGGDTSGDEDRDRSTASDDTEHAADAGDGSHHPPDRGRSDDDETDERDTESEPDDDAGAPDETDTDTAEPLPPISVTVRIDRSARHQTLRGFGAAVAWYGELLLQHPHRQELLDLAFRDLGLDILRLRNTYRGPDGPVDVLAPELIAEASASLGRPIEVFLSSWSPPASLKANRTEECSGNTDCTLAKDEQGFVYEAFADWWLESLEAYAEAGVVPDYISIQNEPDFIPPSWEGCRFAPTEEADYPGYDRALQAVHQRLADYEPRPLLAGPEVIGLQYDKLPNYTETEAGPLIDVVVHHLYDGLTWQVPGQFTPLLREAKRIAGDRPLMQTEFSVPREDAGFETAWLIHNVLVEGDAAGYLYWDLVWVGEEGLISIESPGAPSVWKTPRGYTIRDEYYSVRHYAGFTDPGDRRVDAISNNHSVKASAFLSPDGSRTTVVLLNVGKATALVELENLHAHGSVAVYRSANGAFFRTLPALGLDAVVELPPRGVVTLVQR